jgi:CheY-like chemotaxis protein
LADRAAGGALLTANPNLHKTITAHLNNKAYIYLFTKKIRMLTNKILLIDDDPEEYDILSQTIAHVANDIVCVQAYNCKEGFQKLDASKGLPRFIFLDLNMPASHGRYCLEKIKNHPVYTSIPVVVYTTSDREIDKEVTKKLGAEMFITKPSSARELKEILTFVLSGQWKYN